MTTYVINSTEGQVGVPIEFPLENPMRTDQVFIQPKSKAKIPAMSRVQSAFLFENKKITAKTVDPIGEPLIQEFVENQ